MSRVARAKALAEKFLDVSAGHDAGETLSALVMAAASISTASGRDDVSNEQMAKAFAWTFRRTLDEMRSQAPDAGLPQ